MEDPKSKALEQTLSEPHIHQQWIDSYLTPENEKFYELAFDYITRIVDAPNSSTFLDAGCGNCAHSIRLANRGFYVRAIDFSLCVLNIAEENIRKKRLQDRIKLQREDILLLTFEDATFEYILCWGVLMHIPDIEKAISELSRLLKPGGYLVVSEGNMYSLQAVLLRALKRCLRKERADVVNTPAGLEYWTVTSSGKLLTREANIRWLKEKFMDNGLHVRKHIAGQFTELYNRFSSPLPKNLIHIYNNLWFKYLKIPHPSFGNILILQKQKP